MTEGIIIALITGLCAVIGQALITSKGRKEDAAERARLDERTANRLSAIERNIEGLTVQVKEHNGLKQDIAEIKVEIRNLKEGR